MKINRLFKKAALRFLLLGGVALFAFESAAQDGGVEFHSIQVTIGDTLEYEFYSDPPYLPSLEQTGTFPKHGTADLPGPGDQGTTGWNTLKYIPTASTPVRDTVFFYYYVFDGIYHPVYVTLELIVVPSVVQAVDDYAETTEGQSVTISVLDNDWADVGILEVADVPLVNNGSVVLNPDHTEVTFTPDPDFYGLAHFNYSICDNYGVCDVAKVSIVVSPVTTPIVHELEIMTPMERPVEVLAELDGFDLVTPPSNGSIDSTSEDYHIYIPDAGFVDAFDIFIYEMEDGNTVYQQIVQVHVLDIPLPNTFVRDDQAYGIRGEAVTIIAGANDIGGDNLNGFSKTTNPQNGSAVHLGDGVFEYTPNAGFSGQDQFVYRAMSPDYSITEYGTITIDVSDQIPARESFDVNTAMETPIVLEYEVPIEEYELSVVVEPIYGSVEYFPGEQELTINGQTFAGYNMLIYTPNAGVSDQMDEFEIEYCISGSNNCPNKTVKFDVHILDVQPSADQYCLGGNCVWAGDTNSDGVVNMFDLLPLGLCMGEVGVTRPDPDLNNWFGQYGDDWNDIMSDMSYDLKHIDTDGDGIVGGPDTVAISDFYLQHHAMVPVPVNPGITVPLYFYETSSTPVPGGTHVSLDIWLGDPNDQIAEDIYGLAFSLEYEEDFIDPASVNLSFQNESWLNYNSPVLHLVEQPFDGRIDAGITRTSGKAANGYGVVATLDFVVIEDIDGGRLKDGYIDLKITGGAYMNSGGSMFYLPSNSTQIPLALQGEANQEPAELSLYPNPTRDLLNVHVNGVDVKLDSYSVFTMTGQMIAQRTNINNRSAQLQASDLPSGMYILRAVSDTGEVLTQKFEIID
ncbi:MAG: T9SS type A sorting domain-containing protein [Bacteroidetes bacterium]|nr:T9SS type A sorting domain-containing protein [Bacteroidota bacterium]